MAFDFSPDTPIASADEDRLNRRGFALALANAISNWRHRTSLVIALYGDWGSGKSSIKNMLLKTLDSHTVVEFNPWQITNEDRLTEVFFNDIGAALARPKSDSVEDKQTASRRAAKWKLYGKLFGITSAVSKFAGPAFAAYFGLPGAQAVTAAVDITAAAGEQAAKVAQEAAEALEAQGTAFTPTLTELRRDVTELLSELDQPLLVVLDDLDRLGQSEIRLMLQLVKANADFPNIIYLLLAKREALEAALDGIACEKGADYLEKIVQVSFNVPQANRAQMERVLLDGLNTVVAGEAIDKRWNQEHWAKIYLEGVRPFFKDLRDIKRFLSSMSFHFSLFASDDSFEVNPIDLIGLEVLRVFVPVLYDALPELKRVLTDEPRFMRKEEAEKDRELLKKALDRVPHEQREAVDSLVEALFPPAAKLLADSYYSGDNGWASDLRICSHEAFDKYFQLAVPEGDISQAEIDRIIALVGDYPGLRQKFLELETRGLLETSLDRLDSFKDKLPLEAAETFVAALFDLNVSNDNSIFEMKFSPQTHVARIVYWYLKRVRDEEERFRIVTAALAMTSGLFMPVSTVSKLQKEVSPEKPIDPEDLFQDQTRVDVLRQESVRKITAAAQAGRLGNEKELGFLLSAWRWWDQSGAMQQWVADFIRTREGLIKFLAAIRNRTRRQSGYTVEENYYLQLASVEAFISVQEVSDQVAMYSVEELSDEERALVRMFRDAEQRRAEGRPDRGWE